MRNVLCALIAWLTIYSAAFAQMSVNGQTLYGNEWIDFDKTYYKIRLAEDGIYRVSYDELMAAGLPISTITGDQFQLFQQGVEVAIRTSTASLFGPGDYIEFYGRKNRGDVDKHIFENADLRMLNPEYSLFTDVSTYFLTWDVGGGLRMGEVENALDGDLPAAEDFYMHENKHVFSDFHLKPTHNGTDRVRYASFDFSEGFGSELRQLNEVTFTTDHVFEQGPNPTIHTRFGANSGGHIFHIDVNGVFKQQAAWFDYGVTELTVAMDMDELKDETLLSIEGMSNTQDKIDKSIIAFATLRYPRTFHFDDASTFSFNIESDVFDKYLEIQAFDLTGGDIALYDINNGKILIPEIQDNILRARISASDSDREFFLVNRSSGIQSVQSITPAQFVDYTRHNPSFVILSGRKLYDDPESPGTNWVEEYANYRSSIDGGSFNTLIVDAEELYDQFAYGIDRHSISIRNFTHFVLQHWTDMQYAFIIGKGLEYPLTRTAERFTPELQAIFHVPTFGTPGGDILLFSSIGDAYPKIPVGRLAARVPGDVRLYLEKIIEHENPTNDAQTIEDQLWKKSIIHLSGGDATIQETLFSFLNDMGDVIKNNQFGAEVFTFRKTSSDPIQTSLSQRIIDQINEGVSMITFFGHSAVGTFDFSLEEPSKYENFGRYPLIISLGCHSGNIHTEALGLSEDFVIEEDRAAIAFLASSSSAYIGPQYESGREFYDLMGNDYYGESIGLMIRESMIRRNSNLALAVRTLMEELTLHGDPAIRLHPQEGPDYVVDFSTVRTEPKIVSTNLETFDLFFDVVNLGQTSSDSMWVEIVHQLPDEETRDTTYVRIPSPKYADEVQVTLPVPGLLGLGKNTIFVTVDHRDDIAERPSPSAEDNNKLVNFDGEEGFCFFILDNGARAVHPSEFSIVTTSSVIYQASTSNAFLDEQRYILEVDTTELFDSPWKQRTEILQGGGLIEWNPSIAYTHGRVYYWRISPDSVNANVGYVWNNSSFIYLPNSLEGWNQSHYYQHLKNDYFKMAIDSTTREFQFTKRIRDLRVKIHTQDPTGQNQPWNFIDGGDNAGISPLTVAPVLNVIAWTPKGQFRKSENGSFGSVNYTDFCFPYDLKTPASRSGLRDLLAAIPEGSKVVIHTVLEDEESDLHVDDWAADSISMGFNLYQTLELYGARHVRAFADRGTVPYLFIFTKGDTVETESIADNILELIDYSTTFSFFWTDGEVTSRTIGPSQGWRKVLWSEEKMSNDATQVQVLGIKSNGDRDTLSTLSNTYEEDLSGISSETYPYLELKYVNEDRTDRSPGQLSYWRVQYDGLPDAVLDFREDFVFHKDTLQEGETFRLSYGIRNVTDISMDSLLVKYTLRDSRNNTEEINHRYAPLLGGGELRGGLELDTRGYSGEYELTIEVNPNEDQRELHTYNNFGLTRFYVDGDRRNPLLEVTFDGRHILEGDLVSARPEILVRLKDENAFLLLDDRTKFELALESPSGNVWNVPVDDETLTFEGATIGGSNEALLTFRPIMEEEGDYRLFVQARDASDNFSGSQGYEVGFRVILSEGITSVLNYPNPFSSSTQFVFTLTGSELPSYMKIQIMTLSGKVVREITQEELGPLHIGINRTSYKWNGTDAYGNQLGNGVYLYRVLTRDNNGEEREKYETSIDGLFKEGYGKLVIMR